MDPRGTAGIITGCARNLRSGNVIVFGWPDPTYPLLEFHIETMFKSSPPDVKKCFAPLPCKVLSSYNEGVIINSPVVFQMHTGQRFIK